MIERQNGILKNLQQEIKHLKDVGGEKNKREIERKVVQLEKLMEKDEMKNYLNGLENKISYNLYNQLNEFFNPYNHCITFNLKIKNLWITKICLMMLITFHLK